MALINGIAHWDSREDDDEFGRFVHLENPEGNPIEMWQPRNEDVSD